MMTNKVGYGSPPDHSKWQKGQSGNPRGRPKGRRNFHTDLMAEMAETITITEGGHQRKITKQRAIIKALMARSLKGDVSAAKLLAGLAQRFLDTENTEGSPSQISTDDQAILAGFLARQSAGITKKGREDDA